MPIGLYKAVVRIPLTSGLPEDVVVNDYYFLSGAAGDSHNDAATNLEARLSDIYNAVGTGAVDELAHFMADGASRAGSACSFNFYFKALPLTATPWGSPVATRSWTLDAGLASTNLPAEVSVVSSFHGDLTNIPETETDPGPPVVITRPAARRRGRTYMGPLMVNAGVEAGDNNDLLPNSAVRSTIQGAHINLMVANDNYVWVVYSQTALDVYEVVGGWVDNAFDTQRRRGSAPTTRSVWP